MVPGLGFEDARRGAQQARSSKRPGFQTDPAGLQLREVEDIVQGVQQNGPRVADARQAAALLGVQL